MSGLVVAIGVGPFGRLQSGAMAEVWGPRIAVGVMAVMAAVGTLLAGLFIRGFARKKNVLKRAGRNERGDSVDGVGQGLYIARNKP